MLFDLAHVGNLLQLCFPAERVVMALRTSKAFTAMLLQDGGAKSVILQFGAEPSEGDKFELPSPSVIARSVEVLKHLRKEVIIVGWSPLVRSTCLTAAKEIERSRNIDLVRLRIHSEAQFTACLTDLIDITPKFFIDLCAFDAGVLNGDGVRGAVEKTVTIDSKARKLHDVTLPFSLSVSLLPQCFDPAMQSLSEMHKSRELTIDIECDFSLYKDTFVNAIKELARARTYVTDSGAKNGLTLARLRIVLWVDGMRDFADTTNVSLTVLGLLTEKLSLVVYVRKYPRKRTELLDCWLSGALTALHHAPNVREVDVKVRVLNNKYRGVLRPCKRMLMEECKEYKIALKFSVKQEP